MLDRVGTNIERAIDRIEQDASAHALRSMLLGSLLALAAVVGGIATFVVVLAVLVKLFA